MLDEGAPLPRWFAAAIERVAEIAGVEVVVRIEVVNTPDRDAPRRQLDGGIALRWLRRATRNAAAAETVSDPVALEAVTTVKVDSSRSLECNETSIEPASVELIRSLDLDAILRLGDSALRGEVLDAARDGVWAFDHQEHFERWGQVAGLREVARGETAVTLHMMRLSGAARQTMVLASGTVHVDRDSYTSTLDRALSVSARWPAERCRHLLAGLEASQGAAEIPQNRARAVANTSKLSFFRLVVGAAVREQLAIARRRVRRLLYEEQWGIGVSTASTASWLDDETLAGRVRWMPEPSPAVFLADPFALSADDGIVILAEEFQRRLGRGVVRQIDFGSEIGFTTKNEVIAEPHHLSYPFIVQEGGRRYCIPETADAREVGLYEESDDGAWEKRKTLIPDRDLVDATPFWHSGRWWLWAADREIEQWAALTLWHAPSLDGPWTEHALKPVKLDVRSSRPGGTPFVHEGQLYRPAQDCARTYGARLVINRVVEMSPTAYQEEVVAIIEPTGLYPVGMHHLATAGNHSLVDGKRWMRRRPRDVADSIWSRVHGGGG